MKSFTRWVGIFGLAAAALGLASATHAQVQWTAGPGANGHYYQMVDQSFVSWDGAHAAVASAAFQGVRGHLATVTTMEEQSFLLTTFPGRYAVWIGGFQDTTAPDYREPDGGWRWVDGEGWGFSNWSPGEPNNYPNPGHIQPENALLYNGVSGQWNDAPNDYTEYATASYVIEYEPTAVPEPGSLTLLSIGSVAGLWVRRRRPGR